MLELDSQATGIRRGERSGKTSLLESIYSCTTVFRSFRTNQREKDPPTTS